MFVEVVRGGRQQYIQQAATSQHLEAALAVAAEEELQRFIEEARRRNVREQVTQPRDRLRRRSVDGEVELRFETRGAEHAHRILAITRLGIADETQATRGHI